MQIDQPTSSSPSNFITRISTGAYPYYIVAILAFLTRIDLILRRYPLGFDDGVYSVSSSHVTKGHAPFKEVFSSQGTYFLPAISFLGHFFSDTFWIARVVPMLAGIAVALLTVSIAKRFMTPGWVLTAGIMVAVSGTLIRTTGPITSDGLLVLFSLCTVAVALKYRDNPSWRNAVILGLSLGIGCGIKNLFMVPAIIFVVATSWYSPFVKRCGAAAIAIATFIIPFFAFGFSDVYAQTISYHLGKDSSINVFSNSSKIMTTLSSFDISLVVILALATIWIVVVPVRYYRAHGKDVFDARAHRFFKPNTPSASVLALYYEVPTCILLCLQAPMFRNHVVLTIAPATIIFCSVLCRGNKTVIPAITPKSFAIGGVIFMIVASAISLNNLYHDDSIVETKDQKAVIKYLSTLDAKTIVLTNEPGIAYAADLDVPIGLEDTSEFRFTSTDKKLAITEDTLRSKLSNPRVCAIVYSPLHTKKLVHLEDVVPSSWTKEFDQGYIVWQNHDFNCSRIK